ASQFILPTNDPSSISAEQICGWLAALNRPGVEQVDMTPEQRELILTLVCAYRAFLELPRGVELGKFYLFTAQLVVATTELDPLEDAEPHLREVADWLMHTLP
ncbi:hypothetical protein OH76DRAFT_1306828, partial [Lentinus brumalis]